MTMKTFSFTVSGMSCEHCATAIRGEIGKLPGVTEVQVDVAAGLVTITGEPLPENDSVRTAVEEAGYEVVAG
jgi:copper chaperone